MKRLALLIAFFAPVWASAQVEKASEVRLSQAPGTGPASLTSTPSPITLTAPALSGFTPLPSASLTAPAAVALPAAAAPPAIPLVPVVPASALPAPARRPATDVSAPVALGEPVRDAQGQLRQGGRAAAVTEADAGRTTFDGTRDARPENLAVLAGAAASDGPRLSRQTEQAPTPAVRIPFRQRYNETIELGGTSLGMQVLTGIVHLALGAHASFPAIAGALWMLFGASLITQLRTLRGVLVGGWQASHDQKYRVDTSTGRLRDVRGRKYGEDRYDVYAPGPASTRERAVIDAASFLFGLPWVLPAGPKAVALYTLGAAATYGARRLYRRLRPEPPPAQPDPHFEYDR